MAAQYQCDKHVVKMTLETAQILSTVHHMFKTGFATRADITNPIYAPTHVNHPCIKWAASSSLNYSWLMKHGMALGNEYTYRFYGRFHKSVGVMLHLRDWENENEEEFDSKFPSDVFTDPPLCMPHECKIKIIDGKEVPRDSVEAYRMYYETKRKGILMWWTGRREPRWFELIVHERLKALLNNSND